MRCPRRNSSISVRESSRGLALPPTGPDIGVSVGHTESVMLRVSLLTALCVALVAAGAVVAALLAWPTVGVAASSSGLAGVSLPGFSGSIERVRVTDAGGKPVPVLLRHGTLWPRVRLDAGERLTVKVDVRRPGWIGWLVGGHEQ